MIMSDPALRWTDVVEGRPGFQPLWTPGHAVQAAEEPASPEPRDRFEEGYSRGQRDAFTAFEGERSRYRELIISMEALQPEPSEELAMLIAESVERLVRTTVGEAPIDPELLLERARRAAAIIGDADVARTLHLHPADAALIPDAEIPLTIVADPAMPRGSVRIDGSAGWVEDGVPAYLDTLRDQLGLEERP
jgi:flagellar assembly protein FliH